MAGIEQTTEVVQAAGAVGLFFKQAAADGWGFDDLRRVVSDEALRSKVIAAVRDANQIPGEISDLDLREIMELVATVADEFEGLA